MANHETMEPVLLPRDIREARREASIGIKVPKIMGHRAVVPGNAELDAWYRDPNNLATTWHQALLSDPARFEGLTTENGGVVEVETYTNTEGDPYEDILPVVVMPGGGRRYLGEDGVKPYRAVDPSFAANALRGDALWQPSRFHDNPFASRRALGQVVSEISRRQGLNNRAESFWAPFPRNL